jgi:hypothetical protein
MQPGIHLCRAPGIQVIETLRDGIFLLPLQKLGKRLSI